MENNRQSIVQLSWKCLSTARGMLNTTHQTIEFERYAYFCDTALLRVVPRYKKKCPKGPPLHILSTDTSGRCALGRLLWRARQPCCPSFQWKIQRGSCRPHWKCLRVLLLLVF